MLQLQLQVAVTQQLDRLARLDGDTQFSPNLRVEQSVASSPLEKACAEELSQILAAITNLCDQASSAVLKSLKELDALLTPIQRARSIALAYDMPSFVQQKADLVDGTTTSAELLEVFADRIDTLADDVQTAADPIAEETATVDLEAEKRAAVEALSQAFPRMDPKDVQAAVEKAAGEKADEDTAAQEKAARENMAHECAAAREKAAREKAKDHDAMSPNIVDILGPSPKTASAAARKQSWRIKDSKLQQAAIDHLLGSESLAWASSRPLSTSSSSAAVPHTTRPATSQPVWSKEQCDQALTHARGTYRQCDAQTRDLSTRGSGLDLPPYRRHYTGAKNRGTVHFDNLRELNLDSWSPTSSFNLSPTEEHSLESPGDPNRGQSMKIYHYLPMPPDSRPINTNKVGCPMYSGAPVGVGARATHREDRFRLERPSGSLTTR